MEMWDQVLAIWSLQNQVVYPAWFTIAWFVAFLCVRVVDVTCWLTVVHLKKIIVNVARGEWLDGHQLSLVD